MSAVEEKGNTQATDAATASSQNSGKPTNGENKTNGQQRPERPDQENTKPIMVARNKSGTVKWFSFKHGYGFITVDDDGDDIFVHRSEFIREGAREVFYHVDVGDKLEFDIINRAKGREAVAVTGPNGVRIPGSPASFNRRRNTNSERRGGGRNDEHYDEEHPEEQPNGEQKKRGSGGRGGRRRVASGEGNGQEQQQQQEGEPKGEGKGGRRRPRRNTNNRRGGNQNEDQQENIAPQNN